MTYACFDNMTWSNGDVSKWWHNNFDHPFAIKHLGPYIVLSIGVKMRNFDREGTLLHTMCMLFMTSFQELIKTLDKKVYLFNISSINTTYVVPSNSINVKTLPT